MSGHSWKNMVKATVHTKNGDSATIYSPPSGKSGQGCKSTKHFWIFTVKESYGIVTQLKKSLGLGDRHVLFRSIHFMSHYGIAFGATSSEAPITLHQPLLGGTACVCVMRDRDPPLTKGPDTTSFPIRKPLLAVSRSSLTIAQKHLAYL